MQRSTAGAVAGRSGLHSWSGPAPITPGAARDGGAPRVRRPNGGIRLADSGPIRVLLVDDHAVVRMGLRTFLTLQPDIEVAGEAPDGGAGLAAARRLKPDVVLMDLMMPNMDGVTANRSPSART